MSNVMGLDIGYSNVIAVFGDDSSAPETIVRPAQAVPLNVLPGDSGLSAGEVIVTVDGVEWIAFAAPGRAQEGRELHGDYTASSAYEALFKASILQAAGSDGVIDMLVTGLPVKQARDPEFVNRLIARMTGTHQIAPKVEVTVKKVAVVAQPLGTITAIYCDTDYGELLKESVSLTLDPGFFSVDWVASDREKLIPDSSGSSLKAMSVLLYATSDEIAKDYGGNPGPEKIESALQSGTSYIILFGKKVELKEYIQRAAEKVIPRVFTEIRRSLRFLEDRTIDCVILGGGGAEIYEPFARQYFPDATIIKPDNSVTSNAYGFWQMGR